jgi:eukaryotic-like serine/threonine-protein kinase
VGVPDPSPEGPESDTRAELDTGAATLQDRVAIDPLSDPTPGFPHRPDGPLRRFAPGDVLDDRYIIVEEVGAGGMGVVYKAVDKRLGKPVAIKLIRPRAMNETGIARFRRELALAQRVSHPNVCRLHDMGEVDGLLYISMQHVEGQRLDHLIVSMGHLSPKQTLALGRQLCAGLVAIHEQGIIHRDLKPSNVMVDRAGHVYIMDFGLAVRPEGEDRVTSTGAVLGTLAYLSPEQARGRGVGPQSDIFALGLILYEMLTGRRPPGDSVELPLALRDPNERCPPPSELTPEVPPSLDDVVMRCLKRDTSERFATTAAAAEVLDLAQGDLSSASAAWRTSAQAQAPTIAGLTVPPGTPPTELGRRLRARPAMVILGAAIVLVIAALGIWRYRHRMAPLLGQPGKPLALAVMPFKFSGPDDQAYLKDLLPLLLTERLRQSADLETAPFSSTRTLGANEDVKSVAQQLGVTAAIYGDLTSKDGQLELTLTMQRPDTREAIWTKTVRGDAGSIIPNAEAMAADVATLTGARWKADEGATTGKRNPKALALYAEGRTLLEGWDVDLNAGRAAEQFRRALALDGQFPEAHAGLALALWHDYLTTHETKLVQEALAEAQRAVSLEPNLPEAQLALGFVQLGMGRSAEAAATLEKAEKLAPGDDATCRYIAKAYGALGRPDSAERLLRRAQELRPAYWENYNSAGVFYREHGDLEKATASFQRVVELRPESDVGYANLAGVHLLRGDIKAAEPLLVAALKRQETASAHNNLGFVYYTSRRFGDAAREYEAAVRLGTEAGYYGNLGDAYRQLGQGIPAKEAYQKAIEMAETQVRIDPSNSEQRAALGIWLAGAGRCTDAQRESSRAVSDSHAAPSTSYYAALAAALCGDRVTALRQAARAAAGGARADLKTNPDLLPVLRASAEGRALLD